MNNLERSGKIQQKLWKPQQRKKVTIAIGMICKERKPAQGAILLASDSQTTYGAAKSLDSKKISIVNFLDAQILVAQSGTADLADKAIEIMQIKAKTISLENFETAARVAQESVREIRNYLYDLNKGCITSEDGWKRFFREENEFTLMLAYYFERMPYLYTIDVDWCIPIQVRNQYKGIGIGKNFGEMMLREYCQVDPDFIYGYVVAAAVVERTIDNIDGCGRPTWIGFVYPMPAEVLESYKVIEDSAKASGSKPPVFIKHCRCSLLPQEETVLLIEALKKTESKSSTTKKKELLCALRKAWQKRNKNIMREFKKSTGEDLTFSSVFGTQSNQKQ